MSLIYEQVVRPEDKALVISLPSAIRDHFYVAGGTGLALDKQASLAERFL